MKVGTLGAGCFSRFHDDAWARMEGGELVAACDDLEAMLDSEKHLTLGLEAMT